MPSCPICGGAFEGESERGVVVAACTTCDGLWLAAGDLDRVAGRAVEGTLRSMVSEPTECRHCERPLGFGPTCSACGGTASIECPAGHGRMKAASLSLRQEEFEVDCCATCHGFWIDGHERSRLGADARERRVEEFLASNRPTPSKRRSRIVEAIAEELSPLHQEPPTFTQGLIAALGGGFYGASKVGKPQPLLLLIFIAFMGLLYWLVSGPLDRLSTW